MTPSGWAEQLAIADDALVVRYRTGLKKAERGETLLELRGDGTANVANLRGPDATQYEAVVPRADVVGLCAALVRAGFPDAPVQTIPPGPGLVALEVDAPAEELEHPPVLLHRSFLRDHPQWMEVVQRLDRICADASGGAIRTT